LPYRIEYVQTAINHLRYLTARQRSVVFTGVEQQLMHEPIAETRNRKQMRANPLASWELRLGDLRVYYEDTTVKMIELTQATEPLAEYVKTIEGEPVVIVHRGFALAALVPLDNMDYESIELANNPRFLAILAEVRASYAREGGVSSEGGCYFLP
jgi:deoxycytidine triphosphate deaminase